MQTYILECQQPTVLLAIFGAGAGAAAAILAAVVAWITGDRRAGWTSAAMAVYGTLAIPAMTIQAVVKPDSAPLGNVRSLATATFAVLVVLTVAAPKPHRYLRRPWTPVLIGIALVLGPAGLGLLFPAGSLVVTGAQWLRLLSGIGILLGGLALVRVALPERTRPTSAIGAGFVAIGIAHVMRVLAGPPTESLEQMYGAVRMAGLGLVLIGVYLLATISFRDVDRRTLTRRVPMMPLQHNRLGDVRTRAALGDAPTDGGGLTG